MNYWRRYIGDFQRDTGHLSLAEVGAYDRLLDHYYATEAPLPMSIDVLCRICRAVDRAEREAVQSIADQFFPITAERRHNKRADHEIGVSITARENGKAGGRPRTGSETESGTAQVTGSETEHITGSVHPPTTNHQPPAFNLQESTALSGKPDANGHDYLNQAREILDYLNRNSGRAYRPVDANLKLIVARLKSGATPLQCREVVHLKCEQWGKDAKMAEYLRPATLFNSTKFEQYLGEING